MGEVIKLVKLLMTIPATNASSEREFQHLPPHYNVPGTPEQPDGDI